MKGLRKHSVALLEGKMEKELASILKLHFSYNKNQKMFLYHLPLSIANLSYNFNYNIVESWDWNYSPILQPTTQPPNHRTTQPPNRKSSDNCDISAVTDPILMKI